MSTKTRCLRSSYWGALVAQRVERVPLRPDWQRPGFDPDPDPCPRSFCCTSSPLSPIPPCLSHSIVKHNKIKVLVLNGDQTAAPKGVATACRIRSARFSQ